MEDYQEIKSSLEDIYRKIKILETLLQHIGELRDCVITRVQGKGEHAEFLQELVIHQVRVDADCIEVFHRFADIVEKEEIA